MTRVAFVLAGFLALAAFLAAGCGGDEERPAAAAVSQRAAPACPRAWRAGWQRLADRLRAPVYCPTWLPDPLTGEIGGPWSSNAFVDRRDRSYLMGFIWKEGPHGEIHVNLGGYLGRTAIPRCTDTYTVAGVTRRRTVPCFSDSQGQKRIGRMRVTVYTANRDAEEWHILYAWRRNGSLYTLSEHVALPFTHARVVQNLDRMLRGLVLVTPRRTA